METTRDKLNLLRTNRLFHPDLTLPYSVRRKSHPDKPKLDTVSEGCDSCNFI